MRQFQHWEHSGAWAGTVPDLFETPVDVVQKARIIQNNGRAWGGSEEGFGEEDVKHNRLFYIRLVETAFKGVSCHVQRSIFESGHQI